MQILSYNNLDSSSQGTRGIQWIVPVCIMYSINLVVNEKVIQSCIAAAGNISIVTLRRRAANVPGIVN
jgi:hypothetical protein